MDRVKSITGFIMSEILDYCKSFTGEEKIELLEKIFSGCLCELERTTDEEIVVEIMEKKYRLTEIDS